MMNQKNTGTGQPKSAGRQRAFALLVSEFQPLVFRLAPFTL